MENRYFITKKNYGIVGDIYTGFQRDNQENVEAYCKRKSSEIVFSTPFQNKYIEEVDRLKKIGVTVY